MIIKKSRGAGRTTQMFLDILAGDKDAIIRCRNPLVTKRMFMNLFDKLIMEHHNNYVKLVDRRIVRFMSMEENLTGRIDEIRTVCIDEIRTDN